MATGDGMVKQEVYFYVRHCVRCRQEAQFRVFLAALPLNRKVMCLTTCLACSWTEGKLV